MIEFITNNSTAIVAAIPVIAALVYAIYTGQKKQVAKALYDLVCIAEKQITGTKCGQERKAQVVQWVHEILPPVARLFITDSQIDKMIDDAVVLMKQSLKNAAGADITETEEAARVVGGGCDDGE